MLVKHPYRYWLAVGMLLLVSFGARVYRLEIPPEYYFDEVYHAMTAKLISRNDPRAFEWTHGDTIEPNTYVDWLHPPLAKYTQAVGMLIFGENSFGWRISSALFGVAVVGLTWILALLLFRSRSVALLAMVLVSVDGLLMAQSRIAMNDIHLVAMTLITTCVYVWYRSRPSYLKLLLVGLSAGLTVATKWSGAYLLLGIFMLQGFAIVKQVISLWLAKKPWWWILLNQSLTNALALLCLPLLIYVSSYWLMFAQGKDWSYFRELHDQIFAYQLGLKATHPYQSQPWQWALDLKPVWLYVNYPQEGWVANIYNLGNPLLFWGGLAAVVICVAWWVCRAYRQLRSFFSRNRPAAQRQNLALSLIELTPVRLGKSRFFSITVLLLLYFMYWVPWSFSPRIMFFYHYAPAVPLLAIMAAFVSMWGYQWGGLWLHRHLSWSRIWSQQQLAVFCQSLVIVWITGTVLFFLLWFPHWTALPVPVWLTKLYFIIPSWR